MAEPDLTNHEIAKLLKEMGLFHQMNGVAFKPQAYERAAWSMEGLDRPLRQIYEDAGGEEENKGLKAIQKLDSVGKGIAQRLEELLLTGKIEDLHKMRKAFPVDLFGLMAIEGIGAKKVKALYEGLGVTSVEELAEAARNEQVRELPGFGAKSEQKILRHVELLSTTQGRWPIGEVRDMALAIRNELRTLDYVQVAEVAGSMRRFRETIGDIDILVVSNEHEKVMDYFVGMPGIAEVYSKGDTKTMVRLAVGLDADLRVVDPENYGAALLYFTGSKHHNIVLRMIAIKMGLKLNEYGLFRDEEYVAGRTEEEVYKALELPYFPPEIRLDNGEFEAAKEGTLPTLIEAGDLLGDPHVQSNFGLGEVGIADLADAAQGMGREYIVIADEGLTAEELAKQRTEIGALNEELAPFRILQGISVPILADGSLAVSDEILDNVDFVAARVADGFDLDRKTQTARVVAAVEHPKVHALYHPTARILGERDAIDVDMETIVKAAAKAGTALEVNGQPELLDLKDDHIRTAVAAGAPLLITSNARSIETLRYAGDFGVHVARRGWAEPPNVLNTLPSKDFLTALK